MSERVGEPNGMDEGPARRDGGPPLEADAIGRPVAPAMEWPPARRGSESDDPLLACLVALTRLLGRPTSPQALTAGLPLVGGKLTPELFPRAAERAGLSARLLRRPLDAIDDVLLPCVLLLKDRGAVVMVRRDGSGAVEVVLPETGHGSTILPETELADRYIGYAFFARPAVGFLQRDRELLAERSGHWFWSVILRQWPIYAEVVLAAALINCFAVATSLFAMNVYDRVVPNNAIETLWVLSIGISIVLAFDFLLKMLRGYFVDAAGKVADIKLASRIFEHVMSIRMASRPRSAGAFASNLREFETLRDFFTSATLASLVDLPFLGLFVAIIWMIGGVVAVVPLVGIPLVVGAGLLVQIPLDRAVRQTFREASQKHGVLVEAINGLETIKAVGAESRMQRAWETFVTAAADSANRSRLLSALTVHFAGLVSNLVYVGVIIVGVYEIAAGRLTMGGLIACSILAGRAMAPLGQVAAVLTRYHQAKTALDTLDAIMRLPSERPAERVFVHRPVLKGAIEFKNVTFTYPGQKLPALSDVSFRIAPGERVGLIGRIGSGKSTVEKLVLGLYEPDTGSVLIDGTDVRQIDPADLRRNIGCVPQDVILFQGSIRENITLGAPFADDAAVLRAAAVAGVEDFVSRHPLGYDLNVGERGEALSGGQRQSIAIARALLLDPPILVLDEPTSAMDNSAESRFMQRIARELPGRTLLLVTHRASLLALVERLIVMDNGRIVADGPKDKVLKALASGQIRGEG
ncbi:MAG: type I secretion system permease/ATPase [Geminicoccaceae bacterium]|nr:type I secretion system permease/ATPase [Geminicoccaceae bacterium]MDW8123192.1 type I secretion system permease/ATPase [Geminicoccaceae bacterium]